MIIDFLLDDIRKAIAELGGEVSGLTAESFASVDYVSSAKTIYFYNAADEEVGSIDTTDFVVDGMIDTVSLSGNVLHFVFNTDAGKQPIDVDLSSVMPDLDEYWTSAQTKDYVDGAVSAISLDKLVAVNELPASAEPGTVMALISALISAEWAYWDEPVVDYADSSITYTYHQNANSNKGGTVGTVGFYALGDHPIITVSSRNAGFGGNVIELTFNSGGTSTTQNMYNGINGPRAYFSGNCEFDLFRRWSRLFESTCVVENGDCILTIKIYYEFTIQQAGGEPRIYDAIDQPRTLPTYGVYQYDGTTWNEVGADVDLSAYWTSAQTEDAISAATAGKADKVAVTPNTDTYNGHFPLWNADGVITGEGDPAYRAYLILNGDVSCGFWSQEGNSPSIYAPTTSGTAGDVLVSTGSGAPVWSAMPAADVTKAYVDSAITTVEDHITDVERITASALTELHDDILELSGSSVDLSGYYTSGETDAAISAATAGKANAANVTPNGRAQVFPSWNEQGIITSSTYTNIYHTVFLTINGTSALTLKAVDGTNFPDIWAPQSAGTAGDILVSTGNGAPVWSAMPAPDVTKAYVNSADTALQNQIDTMDDVVSAALVDLNDRKVESASVSTIWKGTTAEYNAIVNKDPKTLYIIVDNV